MAKILVVDDHRTNREFLVTLLAYQHHDLAEASDGREALAAAEALRPDLIISDILMPTMDGYEFVRHLRAHPSIGRTPVIFTTAHYLGREAAALASACNVARVLEKPLEPAQVLEAVAAVLGGAVGSALPTEAPAPASPSDEEFEHQHRRLLAEQLIEKNRALEIANHRLSGLVELGLTLGAERDPKRLLAGVAAAARSLIGARHVAVLLLDERDRPQEHAVAGLDEAQAAALAFTRPAAGPLADTLRDRTPRSLSGVTDRPEALGLPAGYPPFQSLLAIAFPSSGAAHGWICLTDKIGVPHFTPEDMDLTRIIGAKLDIILENIRLCSRAEAHAAHLEAEIAERRRTAAALRAAECEARQAEARYRAVVDTAVDAMVVIDEHGIIQSFNRAAETMFDYAAAEVVGANVAMLMPAPYHAAHDGYLARYARTGERRIIGIGREVEGRRKEGRTFPLELSIAEWQDGGRPHFTGIMRDITQRKESEAAVQAARDEALAAKAAADQANLAKSKFLAAASHDLRQPAQSLTLFTSALAYQLRGHPSLYLVEHLEQSVTALATLLESLLDVSKLDAGAVVPQVALYPVRDLLKRLGAEYRAQAQAKGIDLRVLGCSALVRSDPVLLERMLRNLIENALRYTPRGRIVVGCRRRGARLRVDVIDTGIGIAADTLDAIFEEFFQVGNPERDRSQGLGLGLTIVRRLSRLLDHEIEVRSQPGRGSRFAVYLPLAGTSETGGTAAPAARPGPDEPAVSVVRTILVIDDAPAVRTGLQYMLESWGYDVVAAADGDEACRAVKARGCPPDAIIADYRLRAGETGTGVIARLCDLCGMVVPSVVLTGDTAPERIAEVRQAGHRLLHKPVASSELRAAVTALVNAATEFTAP